MNRRILFGLFVCSLVPWWIGAGLMPLLPLYAARLGAAPAHAGAYLALIFLALAAGTVVGGRLAAPRRRGLPALAGLAALPMTALMGHATHLWQLSVLNAAVWFACGIVLAGVAAAAGGLTAGHERGRVFGLLAMTSSLGGLLGGPAGAIADRWGYPTLFALAAALWLGEIAAALALPDWTAARPPRPDAGPVAAHWPLPAAALLFSVGSFAGGLGRSLAMDGQGFSGAAISGVAALGAGIGLVVQPLVGQWADRRDRRGLLALTYGVGAAGLVSLALAGGLPGFLLASALLAASGAERSVSPALMGDLVAQDALSRALAQLDAAKWIGGVVGLSATGALIAAVGLRPALLTTAGLALLAAALVIWGRGLPARTRPDRAAAAPAEAGSS